ncbi:IQ and ubiquitin-like domain-containing protein, partial [Stegodyphus mimosarum]
MFQENEAQTVTSKGSVSVASTIFKEDDIPLDSASNIADKNENEGENIFLIARIPKKSYFGGYRDKVTGIIYHHAKIQTLPPPWKYGFMERFCRDAQTVILSNQGQQTSRNACSQVQVRNIFIRTTGDKFLAPTQNYVYADEIQADILEKVITLQKYLRRWLAVQELHKLQKFALLQILWEKEQDKLRRQQDSEWEKDIQRRRLSPKNEEDFVLLFSELQKWWNFEVK